MRLFSLCGAALLAAQSALADGIVLPSVDTQVGVSRLLTNDLWGDGDDRWRTGSYSISLTFGQDVAREGLPVQFGALMEYRLRGELLTPSNLSRRRAFPGRPYAGVLGMGAFSHFERGKLAYTLGAELNFVGPSTQIGEFQDQLHKVLGIVRPQMLDDQLADAIYPTVFGSVHRDIALSDTAKIRPFAEAQAGLETYVRVGADLIVGAGYQDAFFTRDPHTGHLVRNANAVKVPGWGAALGGDIAYVGSSELLPTSRGYTVEKLRPRVRVGVRYDGKSGGVFYGLTWLGEEFEGQPDTQVIGSIRANWRF